MAFEISRETRPHYTLYHVQGATTFEGLLALIDLVADDPDRAGPYVLLDCAGMTGEIPLTKLYKVSEHMGRRLQQVFVSAVNMPAHWQNNQFCEDAVYVKGGTLLHFQSTEKAEAWIARRQRGGE